MISKRKDQHIKYAFKQKQLNNDFDKIELEHNSIQNKSIDDIDLSTTFLGFDIPYPFYINAMTGGSRKAKVINYKLAKLASHYNIPLVVGSQSAALKEPTLINTYTIARDVNNGIIVANVNANASVSDAMKAIDMIKANALSIHINLVQELSMDEGDRDFTSWEKNIQAIIKSVKVPVIIKEVGFGMSKKTIFKLKSLGANYIDVSGKGGTNFALIESDRSKFKKGLFNNIGISTVSSLNNAKDIDVEVYASGGIRNALDIYKSIKLGAKAVGLSKYFLDLTKLSFNKQIEIIDDLILDLKKCYLMFE